jgi:hypothetical protein
LNPKRPVLRWTSGRRFPAKCAFFMRLMREPRKLKTRWRSESNSNCRATFLNGQYARQSVKRLSRDSLSQSLRSPRLPACDAYIAAARPSAYLPKVKR